MASTGTGIAKLPATGSTFSAPSTSSMPWLSACPLKFNLPSCVLMTLGLTESASVNLPVRSGSVSSWLADGGGRANALGGNFGGFALDLEIFLDQIQLQAGV